MTIAAIDIETSDPGLKTYGTGAIRNYGEILTVGVYCPDWNIDGWYTWEQFLDDEETLALMADPDVIKVFHNGVYDMNWLQLWGEIEVNNIDDTMTRETLLDAYALSYSLDTCCHRRGVEGKNKGDTIDKWWAEHGGKGKAIEHLKDIPIEVVGKYNLQDCHATYDLWYAQQPLLEAQNLVHCNDIERALYPWLMMTKKNGMRINIKARQALSERLETELDALNKEFEEKYGKVNVGSYLEMEQLWKRLGIPVIYSDTGRPSFSHDVLADTDHPVAGLILRIRGLDKLLNTFIDGQFVDLAYKGFLHPDLYPALRDEGGTVTGRFSSRNPNGQNIPARGDKHGEEIRSLFIPVDKTIARRLGYRGDALADEYLLGAFDYKQIEYRVFTHFAIGPGAEEAQAAYWDHPVDYHQMVQEMMGWVTGDKKKDKEFRHVTKNLNFGSIYGLGARSFAERFKEPLLAAHPGWPKEDVFKLAKMLLDQYFEKIPFVRPTCQQIQKVADMRGYVKTVSGRRQRKPLDGKLYKMVNYLIQGSAGDIMKKAIVDAWNQGVWDVLIPHMMVHDELVFSIPCNKAGYEACIKLKQCMENSYKLKIPLGVDTEIGPDWGHCDETNWKEFENKYKEVAQ